MMINTRNNSVLDYFKYKLSTAGTYCIKTLVRCLISCNNNKYTN
uniref:Uncharacterized protein n=1 Tax=Lepeophtheirus salmonis TaxID=72036 RepID=A0A0K2UMV7_LEPSM